jgi:large subunit ribosomal protein L23
MDLSIYDIILGPVMTEKAYKLNKNDKKLVLSVHPKSNKVQIKSALETLFGVKVDKINVALRAGKRRLVGRRVVIGSDTKKAIVSLKEGYSIDLFDQAGGPVAVENETTLKVKKSAGHSSSTAE